MDALRRAKDAALARSAPPTPPAGQTFHPDSPPSPAPSEPLPALPGHGLGMHAAYHENELFMSPEEEERINQHLRRSMLPPGAGEDEAEGSGLAYAAPLRLGVVGEAGVHNAPVPPPTPVPGARQAQAPAVFDPTRSPPIDKTLGGAGEVVYPPHGYADFPISGPSSAGHSSPSHYHQSLPPPPPLPLPFPGQEMGDPYGSHPYPGGQFQERFSQPAFQADPHQSYPALPPAAYNSGGGGYAPNALAPGGFNPSSAYSNSGHLRSNSVISGPAQTEYYRSDSPDALHNVAPITTEKRWSQEFDRDADPYGSHRMHKKYIYIAVAVRKQ